jgi:hypothetical protein
MSQEIVKEFQAPFEFNKLYEFRLNSEYTDLPAHAVEKITKCITAEYIVKNNCLVRPFPTYAFMTENEWRWRSARGVLTKRVAKWLKDTIDMNLSNETKTAIGTIVREVISKDQDYYFDFVKEFKWPRGNFADGNSCFLTGGDRGHIPRAMEKEKRFGAIRFFKRYNNAVLAKTDNEQDNIYYADSNYYYCGISRAFMCFDEYKITSMTMYKMYKTYHAMPLIIVFNGYGHTTKQIASVLSSFLGLQMKNIGLTNNQKVSGGLYVNSDGILIGDAEAVKLVQSYDFSMEWQNEPKVITERIHQDKIEPIREMGISRQLELKEIKEGPLKLYNNIAKRLRKENPIAGQAVEVEDPTYEVVEDHPRPIPEIVNVDEWRERVNNVWRDLHERDNGVLQYIPQNQVFAQAAI